MRTTPGARTIPAYPHHFHYRSMERYNALTESSGDQLIISPVPRLHNLNYRIASFPYILLIIQFWPSLLNLVITRIDLARLELSGIIQFREYRIIKISVNTVDIVGEGERERERERMGGREWEREKAMHSQATVYVALTRRCSIVFANLFTRVPPAVACPPARISRRESR